MEANVSTKIRSFFLRWGQALERVNVKRHAEQNIALSIRPHRPSTDCDQLVRGRIEPARSPLERWYAGAKSTLCCGPLCTINWLHTVVVFG